MNPTPRISVIIPVHNRTAQAITAVRSVLAQDFPHYELLLVDDGSTECVRALEELLGDNKALFLRIPHSGVSQARNAAVAASKGKWLAFLDSDDYWEPSKLSEQMRFHEQHADIRISQCAEIWFRRGVRVNPKKHHAQAQGHAFARSLELCCISPSAVMLSRELFDALGGFDPEMRICEDYALWLRATAEHPVGFIDKPLVVKHGGHADQLSRSEVALDRYRVYAIVSLLSGETRLCSEQIALCREMLLKKLRILAQGAKKREDTGTACRTGTDYGAVYRDLLGTIAEHALIASSDFSEFRVLNRALQEKARRLIVPILKE